MPNAPKTRGPRPLSAPRPPDSEPEERDQVDVLTGLLEQFQGGHGYSVRVERVPDVGMRRELVGYLGLMQLTADLYDEVMEAWGGGKFRGRIYRGPNYETSITFQIAGDPKPRQGVAVSEQPVAPSALEASVKQLAEGQAQLIELLRNPPQRGAPLEDALAIVKAMREVATAPPPPAQDPLQLFTLFDRMLELRQRVAEETGERQPDNGIAAILRDGVQPLVALVREKMALDTQREQRAARTLPAGSSSPSADPVQVLAARIPTMGRAFLASAARAGKQPGLYAEVVLDQLPDADYAALPALLQLDDFVPRLLQAVPQWAPFPEWFSELTREILRSVEEALAAEGVEIEQGPAPDVESEPALERTA